MDNVVLHTVRAAAQERAAQQQHDIAQAIPHGFRATTDQRAQHWMEKDIERGMWASQRRSAAIA